MRSDQKPQTIEKPELSEPDCCGMTPSGSHTATCPLALSTKCDDCGSEPGVACFPYCYALLGLDDEETR